MGSNYLWERLYDETALDTDGWDYWTLSDVGVEDQTIEGNGAYANTAEEMTVNSYGTATNTGVFDHLVVSGEFLFKETANAYVNIGGADSTKGLKLYSDVETGSLKLAAASDSDTVVTMTSKMAGATLVGEPVHIDITSQFVDMDGDDVYNDLKLGVYFNGLLYNATYYYYKDYVTNGEFGNHLGFYSDDGGKICVASEYTVDATQKTYDLTNGVYTTFKDEIEYAKFGEWIRTPLDSTNGLDIPGEYEISQYQGMKKESLDIYMTSDSNTDGTIDIRDLVSVKKVQAKTAASGKLPTIQALSVDADKDGVINDSEVSAVVQKLLYGDTSVASLSYESGVMPISGYYGPYNCYAAEKARREKTVVDIKKEYLGANIREVEWQ